MTSYLRTTGPFPFTAEEICVELCIDSQYVELLIKTAAIAPICIMQHARSETWAVTVTPRFNAEIVWSSGRKPVCIGEAYELNGKLVRDCAYEPSAERIEKARRAVIRWVMRANDPAIVEALANGEEARKAKSRAAFGQQLTASLAQVA